MSRSPTDPQLDPPRDPQIDPQIGPQIDPQFGPPSPPPAGPPTVPMVPLHNQYLPPALAAARRAGWLMIGIGALTLVGGGCFSLVGAALPSLKLPPDAAANLHQIEQKTRMAAQTMMWILAGIFLAVGVYQIIMGVFVRRGGRRSIRAALIITAMLATVWTLQLLVGLFQGDAASLAGGAGLLLITVCLLAWQLSWLLQALHVARQSNGRAPSSMMVPESATFLQRSPAYPPQPPPPVTIGWSYPPPPPPRDSLH